MVVQTARDAAKVRFDERGLVPCVMQDARSGEVLTLAYMNEEALQLTLETREIHLYSRSRREIWHKGATSGNIQRVRQIRYDCDGDALVALVDPAGPACHTGERSCFYRDLEGTADPGVDAPAGPGRADPAALRGAGRAGADPARAPARAARAAATRSSCSRTRGSPATRSRRRPAEVVKAVSSESEERVAEEGADVVYHLAVLLLSRGVSMAEVLQILNGRRAMSSPMNAVGGDRQPAGSRAGPRIAPASWRGAPTWSRFATASSTTSRPRSAPSSSCAATARPSCSSRRSRAGSAAGPSSASGRDRSCAGATGELSRVGRRIRRRSRVGSGARPRHATHRTPTRRSPTTSAASRSPSRMSCRRSPAAPSASSATTSCARSSRSASRTPTRSACPTWR